MFYATRIQSVSNGVATDEHGRTLRFIGFLNVKAGDTVYTDGRVIFGNVKPKGGSDVADDPNGIPALADNLRGYFTKNGRFNRYKIKGEEWIVNGKKNFFRDTGEAEIIDAEIALEDGKETGVYAVEKITRSENDYDCELIIRKDELEISRIKMRELSAAAETLAKSYVEIVDVPNHTPEDLIDVQAWLRNFKILSDGSWAALVEYDITAERRFEGRDEELNTIDNTVRTYEEGLFDDTFDEDKLPGALKHTIFDTYRPISWSEETISYGVTYTTYEVPHDKTYSTTAHCKLIFKFSSDDDPQKIFEQSEFTPFEMEENEFTFYPGGVPDDIKEFSRKHIPQTDTFPYPASRVISRRHATGGTYYEFIIYGLRIGVPVESVIEDNRQYSGWVAEALHYDSRNLPDAPDYKNGKLEYDSFSFPVQDDFAAQFSYNEDDDAWHLDSVTEDGTEIFSVEVDNPLQANLSVTPLRRGYLFGVRHDKLYTIDENGIAAQRGYNFKNFRLRELKKMSRAK